MELDEGRVRDIVAHFARMRARYGELLEGAELVLPTGEFFPDDFAVDAESIHHLVRRMATYAPLSSDVDLAVGFVEPEEGAGGGCGSGACSPGAGGHAAAIVGGVETDRGYGVLLRTTDVGEPSLLTAAIARALGRIVLLAAGEEVAARDEGPLSELTAASFGLGAILLGGSCVYKKGCGGMRMHQGTFLDPRDLSLALALFVRTAEVDGASVKRHLEATQREAFEAALAWTASQPALLRALRDAPETLEDGIFELERKKGFLARLLGGGAERPPEPPAAPSKRPARTEAELRRLAEAKALVDEAFDS